MCAHMNMYVPCVNDRTQKGEEKRKWSVMEGGNERNGLVEKVNYRQKEEVRETGWWKVNEGKFNKTKEERKRGRKE